MSQAERRWLEAELRRRSLAGDEAAWSVLHRRAFRPLLAWVARRAPAGVGIEDVVQECWLVAVKRIADFDPERGAFLTWLFGIAERVVSEHGRRHGRRRDGVPLPDQDSVPAATDDAGTHDRLVAGLHGALVELPERYRDVLRAKYLEKRSVAEIAGASMVTEKSVESLLTRARSALKERLRSLLGGDDGQGESHG